MKKPLSTILALVLVLVLALSMGTPVAAAPISDTYTLDLTPDGSSTIPGTPFDVTVTAYDSYGNVATGYTGTVTFTSTDSGSGVSLPADYTFLPGDNGVKVFTDGVTLVTAGSQDITVTDTANGSLTDTETWDVGLDVETETQPGGSPTSPNWPGVNLGGGRVRGLQGLNLLGATTTPHIEVGKVAGPDPVSIDEEGTVTLTLTGAGNPISERRSLDVMLIIDRSGSMGYDNPTRLSQAKVAAKAFIDKLDSSLDHVGLVSYSTTATLNRHLTNDFTNVKSAIDGLSATGSTNIGDAIYTANNEFTDHVHSRADAIWVEILLTDGLPNRPNGPGNGFWEADAAYARTAAEAAHTAGITLYTIGLGAGVSKYFLDDQSGASEHHYNPGDPAGNAYPHPGLAYVGGGKFYYAPTGANLQAIFEALAYELITIAGQNTVLTEVLPAGVHYVPGSIIPPPDSISTI